MEQKYVVSRPALMQYYNIVGVDFRDVDFRVIDEEERCLEHFSPQNYVDIPNSSAQIDEQMLVFIGRMCTCFGYSEEEEQLKYKYYRAFMGILNVTTNLNLIPEDNTNYKLHFERLNRILLMTMLDLNCMDPINVIQFYEAIRKGSVIDLHLNYRQYPNLLCLTLLGINSDRDIEDYQMFRSDDSIEIDFERISNLLRHINLSDTYTEDEHPFRRLSYRKSLELKNNRK